MANNKLFKITADNHLVLTLKQVLHKLPIQIICNYQFWFVQGRRTEIDLQLKKNLIGIEDAEEKQKVAWLW